VTDIWSERAEEYRRSEAHRKGRDLQFFAEWAAGRTVLDVATGGGHVAERLREAGCEVVTCDSAPGMQPDVICRAEDLPFADSSFDVVTCRVAAHHFEDVPTAVQELARVSGDLVLIADNLFLGEAGEEADRLRDPTHVRNYSEEEWRAFFGQAGLEVEVFEREQKWIELEPWLERAGCTGEEAERVRELLADRIENGRVQVDRGIFKARKR
jgi:ubiquinone/menaquinone biosynthesis C-methylase UbiE